MSKIEWTNKTWNPTTGCNKISQGCKNCYAEKMHKRLAGMGQVKYAQPFADGVVTHEDELDRPGEWKTPCLVFVDSMSDLFHKDVPFEFIAMVFNHMAYYNWHTYQVLTKRADRMLEFYKWFTSSESVIGSTLISREHHWPLPNVWIGVSCEDQENADARIPLLLQVPAAIRFLSCEPLLSEIDLRIADNCMNYSCADFGMCTKCIDRDKLHWVIAGGESGHNARPVHPAWLRSIRYQCQRANIPFFFKQWGNYIPLEDVHERDIMVPDSVYCAAEPEFGSFDNISLSGAIVKPGITYAKVGKHRSGNFLDGKQHLEFPKEVTHA